SDVAQQKVNIHSMSIQSIVDLVSDPHTLLPYSVTKTKSNTLNFDISGQKTTTEKIEVYESSFKYKKRGT
ncbi:MAG: hypothetical protein OEZ58_03075, partial [Gammaproteobacteria bacterium]|nr:hypothetical protein [Gammaproteobacteria bacterium]